MFVSATLQWRLRCRHAWTTEWLYSQAKHARWVREGLRNRRRYVPHGLRPCDFQTVRCPGMMEAMQPACWQKYPSAERQRYAPCAVSQVFITGSAHCTELQVKRRCSHAERSPPTAV
jgi:hypothetical protein